MAEQGYTEDVDMEAQDSAYYTPTFSAKTRTRVYVSALIGGSLMFVSSGVAAIFHQPELGQVFGLVGTVIPTVAAGFGVAYRPTK